MILPFYSMLHKGQTLRTKVTSTIIRIILVYALFVMGMVMPLIFAIKSMVIQILTRTNILWMQAMLIHHLNSWRKPRLLLLQETMHLYLRLNMISCLPTPTFSFECLKPSFHYKSYHRNLSIYSILIRYHMQYHFRTKSSFFVMDPRLMSQWPCIFFFHSV